MNDTPLGERVIIKQEKAVNKNKSGLYIPETAKKAPPRGEVVAVKEGEKYIKVGDTVLFENGKGIEIYEDGEEYLVIEIKNLITIK